MGAEQIQYKCLRCHRHTLHTRNSPKDVPHVLYLLLSLLCCGLFVPVWMIHVVLHSLASAEPFRCTQCGQQAGEHTAEQIAAIEQRKAAEKEKARAYRGEMRQYRMAWLRYHAAMLWTQAKEVPGQIDRLIQLISGEGNDIIYRFLQIFIYVALPLVLMGIFFYAVFR